MAAKIFKIDKTLNSDQSEQSNGNESKYECVFFDCTESFNNYKLWKHHFDKHVRFFILLGVAFTIFGCSNNSINNSYLL